MNTDAHRHSYRAGRHGRVSRARVCALEPARALSKGLSKPRHRGSVVRRARAPRSEPPLPASTGKLNATTMLLCTARRPVLVVTVTNHSGMCDVYVQRSFNRYIRSCSQRD
ncbi:hypothetical protein PLICRDRAFT_200791 [Plicaturopsis crispa FD-325 SS-3]|nr:hypothetical protein PLICRDRAFT_200791 [Plicaturopsis crispa FD-325 SS-3]